MHINKRYPVGRHAAQQIFVLLAVFFCLAFSEAVTAKDVDGEFVTYGVGANNCFEYIKARRQGDEAFEIYKHWLSGYLTAFNLIVTNTYDIIGKRNYAKIIKWLDRYCNENRQENFSNAVALLTVKLYPARQNLAPNKDTKSKWTNSGTLYNPQ